MLPEGIMDVGGVEAEAEVATMHHQPTSFYLTHQSLLAFFHGLKYLHCHIFIHIADINPIAPFHCFMFNFPNFTVT
jgi:hypothetical protein